MRFALISQRATHVPKFHLAVGATTPNVLQVTRISLHSPTVLRGSMAIAVQYRVIGSLNAVCAHSQETPIVLGVTLRRDACQ